MGELRWWERTYFGVVAVAALFVSWLGFFAPARMDESFTWASLPPLHARFVGSLYLFGGVYLMTCAMARSLAQVRLGPPAVIAFTLPLLAVTLLNESAFDYDLGPVRVWTGSYVVYPLLGVFVSLGMRRPGARPTGPALPSWGRRFLVTQAVVFGIAGIALLVARDTMVDVWPWPITAGLAQFYGGPLLAYAFCSAGYSRSSTWTEGATVVPAMAAFAIATLAVSIVHRDLFSVGDAADWAWFTVFAGVAVCALALWVKATMARLPIASPAAEVPRIV